MAERHVTGSEQIPLMRVNECVCIGPDLLNTFYKRQHVSRFCRLKLGEKWDSPYSDSFAFSRFSLVSEHAAQSAFVLWGFFSPPACPAEEEPGAQPCHLNQLQMGR